MWELGTILRQRWSNCDEKVLKNKSSHSFKSFTAENARFFRLKQLGNYRILQARTLAQVKMCTGKFRIFKSLKVRASSDERRPCLCGTALRRYITRGGGLSVALLQDIHLLLMVNARISGLSTITHSRCGRWWAHCSRVKYNFDLGSKEERFYFIFFSLDPSALSPSSNHVP